MFATRARFTASTIRRASATFRASGFSQSIALPARAAAIAISACESLGVQISTMSINGSAMIAFQSITAFSQPRIFAARLVPARSRPQIAAIRISAGKSKKRGACRQALEWARPMNFVPMSATERARRFGMSANEKCGGNRVRARALPARSCSIGRAFLPDAGFVSRLPPSSIALRLSLSPVCNF